MDDYALSLDAGPLCAAGPAAASVVAGVNAGDAAAGPGGAPVAPVRTASGGFAGYHPVATLPAYAGYVIDLGTP